ncbi:succinate dehydrogenase, cytochrome b556 subunit [Micrococcus sp.]|uniref:succinate dehydrogenase, cytochrome b556 subunit n=1 Tax=Micrococcus sp. TaxID=1271 RepID=UPI002A90C239|nr:succinate dehydrogenase, cytochrome b556 subunit [Micrococcus sp.]MDY6054487.1 succinate dehydrogenase, cytochrome b556 subunit [Micrococcus sp.]
MSSATAQAPASTGRGTLYRGHGGMWSWVGHRVTGVVIFFYLLVHVLDTAMVRVSPEVYDAVIDSYKTWYFALGETALVAAILFHALNGVRIILVDFWKGGTRHHLTLLWVVLAVWAVLFLGFAVRHLSIAFGGH